ncbi:hypothetical protein EDD63_12910 [Breznakia blatticola]|uniref:Uncharacterized protein n=2 Tax=Breznakia blatticola TaxID=1754012 RepID=A0A4R7ZGA6_9FIRM|nr:hypothetical protein EDD63_12910 [Breznakia blatticola]
MICMLMGCNQTFSGEKYQEKMDKAGVIVDSIDTRSTSISVTLDSKNDLGVHYWRLSRGVGERTITIGFEYKDDKRIVIFDSLDKPREKKQKLGIVKILILHIACTIMKQKKLIAMKK